MGEVELCQTGDFLDLALQTVDGAVRRDSLLKVGRFLFEVSILVGKICERAQDQTLLFGGSLFLALFQLLSSLLSLAA